jgi:hypothetical protein
LAYYSPGFDVSVLLISLMDQESNSMSSSKPPRKKHPYDSIDRHKTIDGCPKSVRIPVPLQEQWMELRRGLNRDKNAVFHWLFKTCARSIKSLLANKENIDPTSIPFVEDSLVEDSFVGGSFVENLPSQYVVLDSQAATDTPPADMQDLDNDPDLLRALGQVS